MVGVKNAGARWLQRVVKVNDLKKNIRIRRVTQGIGAS